MGCADFGGGGASEKQLIETVHGKRHKYEIYRVDTVFETNFSIHRDGQLWKAGIKDLASAVQKAREAG
jgi:hypothetical protein